jgi:3',5'-cyclic AMP phosphodiesterase CpdA
VEFLDTTQRPPGPTPFSAAYRPQESLTSQVVEAMVRQVRDAVSPVTGQRLDLTVLTGDNADSQQYNETRWFIDILDGTTGSANPDPDMDPSAGGHQVDPDSGIVGSGPCGGQPDPSPQSSYDGVRGGGRPGPDTGYYEPDGSSGASDDGDGYSPDRNRNKAEASPTADVTVRDFPGLLDAAQSPFEALGLGMPWYTAFGNHDALVQGNSPDAFLGPLGAGPEKVNPSFDAIARGCSKPSNLPAGVSPEQFLSDPSAFLAASSPVAVPPDPRRCHVAKDVPNDAAVPCSTGGWIQQHDRTAGTPRGHGFRPFVVGGRRGPQAGVGRPASAVANHDGYYSFFPRAGLRFVVLDTITDECGATVCADGSVDDTQYRWLAAQIADAAAHRQYVVVFSHHTLRTTRMPSTDPTEQPIHYGERVDRRDGQPVRPDAVETLEDLFCASPNVLAHVDGHEHGNLVIDHRCEDPGQGPNRFWEISTAAHIDWPQQSRMIELVRGSDGRLALVATMLDHSGAPNPGVGGPGFFDQGSGAQRVLRVASVAREIGYNDYQHDRGARGAPADRNVVLGTGRAWPYPGS